MRRRESRKLWARDMLEGLTYTPHFLTRAAATILLSSKNDKCDVPKPMTTGSGMTGTRITSNLASDRDLRKYLVGVNMRKGHKTDINVRIYCSTPSSRRFAFGQTRTQGGDVRIAPTPALTADGIEPMTTHVHQSAKCLLSTQV